MLENREFIDYTYSINIIREIANKNKNTKNKIAKIIMSKICIDLIKNFKATGKYKDEYQEEIKSILEENNKIIIENMNIFETIGLEINGKYLEENNIDKIYADVINSFIKNKGFENYEFVLETMKEIDIENIIITQKICDELSGTLSKEELVKEYKIIIKEDIFIENKINFYFILLKYIFKSSFYIYNINFFLETRKLIINLLKENIVLNKGKNITFNEKITYVIKKLADSDYYFKKLKKLELVFEYYKEILFESKKDDILLIEDIFNNNKKIEDGLLIDYEAAEKIHKKIPIIKFIFEEKNELNKRTEKEMKRVIVEIWPKLEKMILTLKIKRMKDDERKIICKYFRDKNNKNFLLEIFGNEIYDKYLIKINDYFKLNEALEKEDKREEKPKKDLTKNIISTKNKNINTINTNTSKEKETPKIDSSMSNKIGEEDSTTFETFESQRSVDLHAPNPIRRRVKQKGETKKGEEKTKQQPENNILKIAKNILPNCHISFHTNKKGFEPFIIYDDIYYGEYDLKIGYSRLMQYKEDLFLYEGKEASYNDLKFFFDYLDEIEDRIRREYENEFMVKINVDLFEEKELKNKEDVYNIGAYYTFFEPEKYKRFKYKEENVLINKTNSHVQGFQFMLYDMNSEKYRNIKYSEELLELIIKNEIGDSENEKDNVNYNYFEKSAAAHEITASEYTIIEYIKTLGKTKYSADFIKELSNGYFIIGSQNTIQIYDHQFLEKQTLSTKFKDWVYSICERVKKNSNDNKNLQIICCLNSTIGLLELTEKKVNLTTIETQQKKHGDKKSKKDKSKNTFNICIEMREDNYIMAGLRVAAYYTNFFGSQNKIEQEKITKEEESYRSGIKLSENIVALTSNQIIPEGKDKLIFYNVKSKTLTQGLEGYSFLVSEHNMALIPRLEKETKNKILICLCKKYIEGQKNGIVLVNPNLGEYKEIKNPFYDLGDIEIYCICPILNIRNKNENYEVTNIDENYKKNIEIEDTDFFLVGAYDEEKREGVIKLFKILFSDNIENTKIKFLQNIEIENKGNFQGFGEQIKCMIQSRISGNIIITCADGKIYLFTKPNLDLYIKEYK